MPRRKKNGQSPARVPGGPPPEGGSLGQSDAAYYRLPQGHDAAMAYNFTASESQSGPDGTSSTKEEIARSMREMFSCLDPEVIDMVLSECDFKVETTTDALLQLSAEDAVPVPPPVSGFERTAAALLNPQDFPAPQPDQDVFSTPEEPSSPLSTSLLTEELDLLVDKELETLTAKQEVSEDQQASNYVSAGASFSTFPPPLFLQQPLPELLQSSLNPRSAGGREECVSASSTLDQLSFLDEETPERKQSVVDFKHLLTGSYADKVKPPLDLAASGRPSAFQVYKKQDPSHSLSGVPPSDPVVRGARSKMNTLTWEPLGYMTSPWNLDAQEFSPSTQRNQGPTFITPVAQTSNKPWPSHVGQAPLKPSATIPKSWALSVAPQPASRQSRLHLEGKLLVLLRGAPGSGKSTLARALLEHNPGGTTLSTDDYFLHMGEYHFDPTVLGEAHEWNQKRAKEAFERGTSPIIIDNTNMQGWEMRPYVAMALKHRYKVLFREPETWWKNKPRELERRSSHNVPVERIRRMLNGYERSVSISSIMGSRMPEWKEQLVQENKNTQPLSSETPDLVGEPGLTEFCKNSQLFSSLPDVSSIGRSLLGAKQEDSTHKSTESLNFSQPAAKPTIDPEMDNDKDFVGLDSEPDPHLQLNNAVSDQRIPDCIVESVMNEDLKEEELPWAFSTSIAQRVRRERPSRRSEFDRLEPADVVKDTNQSEHEGEADNGKGAEVGRDEDKKEIAKTLDFVGDWPTEESRDQRQMSRRERHSGEDKVQRQADDDTKTKVQPGPDITEFQKVLDLLQIGVGARHFGSSHTSPLSMTADEEILKEAGGCEEREHSVDNSRGELPDCVLDWKAADSCGIREANMDNSDEAEREAAAGGGGDNSPRSDGETPESMCPLLASDFKSTAQTGTHNTEGVDVIKPGAAGINSCSEEGKETGIEADSSLTGDVRQSPMCEGSVEAEGTAGIGSQERKQRQGRRSGKQCKLALTFTQNCPGSALTTPDSPTAQDPDSGQNSVNADVNSSVNADCDASPNPEPGVDLSMELNSEAHPPSPPPSSEETGNFTQTEPQDFAFLWRLNHQDRQSDDAILAASSGHGDNKVLYGNSSRFLPERSSAVFAAVAVCPLGKREVLYRVVLEKSTQVEEKELGGTHDRLESLCILSRHFKLVSFDTLEDLYDKCHQDLEWTTNLLLDSGERFFKEEDGEEVEGVQGEDGQNTRGAPQEVLDTSSCPTVLDNSEDLSKGGAAGFEEQRSGTAVESNESITNSELLSFEHGAAPDQSNTTSHSEKTPPAELSQHEFITAIPDLEGGAWGWDSDVGLVVTGSMTSMEDEMASMDEIHRLFQTELEELERENKQQQKRSNEERGRQNLDIQSVELRLPTEVALQLTELFGPVGLDPGSCSSDDYDVQMDLSLAKLLHLKWKETIQEKQKQAALAFHLLQESSAHNSKFGSKEPAQPGHSLTNTHRPLAAPHISLRDIIKEEQVLQANLERTRKSRSDLDRRDGSTSLKEDKLFSLFPTIDRHFLLDIFRDHNYCLTQTELFLRSILDEEPVKTVVAPEIPRSEHLRAASKEREKRQKPPEMTVSSYQDVEDPEYEDFRAEANLQRSRQLESFSKAAEAHKQGRREVASFYAQQGHLHGQRMREANHRAAVQIFQRVNSSLLPRNILDLHGLHVDEALGQLAQVLQDKSTECEQGLCRPQLSVITGRGNRSQGGVARIRPAVIDYLTNKHYRFTEPNPGLVLVSLK